MNTTSIGRWTRPGLLALAILTAAMTFAADAQARGTVLRVSKTHAYVDLGTDAGVANGSLLVLFHVIKVKHPGSGKLIRDSFPLAKLRVVNAGKRVSLAVIPEPFRKRIAVGDEIELESEPVVTTDPWLHPKIPLGGPGPIDPYATSSAETLKERRAAIARAETRNAELVALESVWAGTLGQPPAERVLAWQKFLVKRPRTPFASAVAATISELESEIEASRAVHGTDRVLVRARARLDVLFRLSGQDRADRVLFLESPTSIDEGVPVSLAFLALSTKTIANAWLYFRTRGEPSFRRVELVLDGDSYLVGEIPGDVVRPGGVEFFVDLLAHSEGSEPFSAIGSDKRPERIAVNPAAEKLPVDTRGRSRASFRFELVDFDGVGSATNNDQYYFGEVDFMYRFRHRGLYSLRLGFGSMEGRGGPKDVIDEDPVGCLENGINRCRDVAYNYAYTELEWHISDYFGFMLRPQVGSAFRDVTTDGTTTREFFDAFGLRGRLRFGREDSSNLVLGVAATEELGKLFEAAFSWDVITQVPLVFSVHVTNQPVLEDFGVRLLADIGWQRWSWFYPTLRIAYQARDIDHAGLSLGTAIHFDW